MRAPDLNLLERAAEQLALLAYPPRILLANLPHLLEPPLLSEVAAHPERFRLMAARSGIQIITGPAESNPPGLPRDWEEACVFFWALHQFLREQGVPDGPGVLHLLLRELGAAARQRQPTLSLLSYVLLTGATRNRDSGKEAADDLGELQFDRSRREGGSGQPEALHQALHHLTLQVQALPQPHQHLGLFLLCELAHAVIQSLNLRMRLPPPPLFHEPEPWDGEPLTDPAHALQACGTCLPTPLSWTWLQQNTPHSLSSSRRPVWEEASVTGALDQLARLPGLSGATQVLRSLIGAATLQRTRGHLGLRPLPLTLHAAFLGHPGTGKTTAARLYARALHEGGLLGSDQIVEVERADLIGGYLGQSALKVRECLDRAMDGTLLIDEAYSLTGVHGPDHYAQEAIDTLVRGMEERRSRLAVLLTGYPEEMERLFQANPGLRSRVTRVITFPDHDPATLMDILLRLARDHDYRVTPAGQAALLTHIQHLHAQGGLRQGNARLIRTLLEQMIERQAERLRHRGPLSSQPVQLLNLLEEDDLPGPWMPAPSLLA